MVGIVTALSTYNNEYYCKVFGGIMQLKALLTVDLNPLNFTDMETAQDFFDGIIFELYKSNQPNFIEQMDMEWVE